jgi:hypothetical protein
MLQLAKSYSLCSFPLKCRFTQITSAKMHGYLRLHSDRIAGKTGPAKFSQIKNRPCDIFFSHCLLTLPDKTHNVAARMKESLG